MNEPSQELEARGFLVLEELLCSSTCDAAIERLAEVGEHGAGNRNLLRFPWCQALGERLRSSRVLEPMLPRPAALVQCTLFDKSKEKNWLVALHQDLSIPMHSLVAEAAGTGWTEKQGTRFVQAPVTVLESLIAVRLHLDPCGSDNGALRVVPQSHRFGRLDPTAAQQLREKHGEVECLVSKGGAILMRPLLLHASSKARAPLPRRVLHFLFGPAELPQGLRWPQPAR